MADSIDNATRSISLDSYQQAKHDDVQRAAQELESMLDRCFAEVMRADTLVPISEDDEKTFDELSDNFNLAAAAFERVYPTALAQTLPAERDLQERTYLEELIDEATKCLNNKRRGPQRLAQLVDQFEDRVAYEQEPESLTSKSAFEQGESTATASKPSTQISELSTDYIVCKKVAEDEITVELSERVRGKQRDMIRRLEGRL